MAVRIKTLFFLLAVLLPTALWQQAESLGLPPPGDRVSGWASTAAFGARCIGPAFDDTGAFQLAIDTGRTVYAPALSGRCHISHPLIFRTPGQIIIGDGRARTQLLVEPGFTGAGVLVAATGEPGPEWRDFSVRFEQPYVPELAKLVRYPPAFMTRGTPRFQIKDVGCYLATTCIDMTGNTGGATVSDFQMSAFEAGIDIDGAEDTVRLISIHAWPFGAAGPKQMAQILAGVKWLRVGRVDDLKIVGGMFLGGVAVDFRASSQGAATGSITNTDFDSNHRAIVMSAGNISVAGGYFASGGLASQQVVLTGGTLGIYGATIGCSSTGTTPLPAIEVAGQAAFLTILGAPSFSCGMADRPMMTVQSGNVVFSDNTVAPSPNVAYRYPKIELLGRSSRLTAIGNRIGDKGVGDGIFFSIAADNFNRVLGNAAPGWRSTLKGKPMPLTAVSGLGVYFGN